MPVSGQFVKFSNALAFEKSQAFHNGIDGEGRADVGGETASS